MQNETPKKRGSRGLKIQRHPLLDNNACKLIHEASCKLLEVVGVGVTHPGAVELFTKEGAQSQNGRTKIPREMVERAVDMSEKKMVLGARNPDNTILIDSETPLVHFGTGGQALNVLHYEEGHFHKKPAATEDLIDIIRLCEHLDNVDFITRPVEPDVPDEEMDLAKTRIFLDNTTKHINLANLIVSEKLPEIIQTVQNKSLISFISCVLLSPLSLAESTTEKFMNIVEADIPVSISSCPQAGTTAPLSEIGELIQVNAEMLSAVVLANLVRPGAKVLYRGIPVTSNLHIDASPRWCQPDSIRRIALASDMSFFYGIPCCGTAAVSDEKEPNPQAVAEKTLSLVFETASGAQFINSALGMLEQVVTVCPEQYIIDHMVIGRIKQLFSGPDSSDLRELGQVAVKDALALFAVEMDSGMKNNISDRIEFILSGKEKYTPENMQAQVELIADAVCSGKSSSKFIKTSRKGLRRGWIFTGPKIDGKLELDEVHTLRKKIMDMYGS